MHVHFLTLNNVSDIDFNNISDIDFNNVLDIDFNNTEKLKIYLIIIF